MRAPPHVVLDTNLAISTLVFSKGRLAELRHAWQAGHFTPLASKATTAELLHVLAYPRFKLDAEEQEDLLADYLPWCQSVEIPNPPPATPACRDPFDLPFLQLALVGRADVLVSGDRDLLCLDGQLPCPIVNAVTFLEGLGTV